MISMIPTLLLLFCLAVCSVCSYICFFCCFIPWFSRTACAVQVMKAINNNSYAQLQNAVGFAPRGERSNWVLIVKVCRSV